MTLLHQVVEAKSKFVYISKHGLYIYMFSLKKIELERQDSKEPAILNMYKGRRFLSNRK